MLIGGVITSISDTSSFSFITIEGQGVKVQLTFDKDDPRVLELARQYRRDVTVEINVASGTVRRIA